MFRKTKDIITKILFIVIGIIFLMTTFRSIIYGSENETMEYIHEADPSTMEEYGVLINGENGSRYAGRIWADKSVYTNNEENEALNLTNDKDGYEGEVKYNTDFLNVFSALGSSQELNQHVLKPVDVVLLLDISSSMTKKNDGVVDTNDPLHQVINQTNTLINQLMGKDPSLQVHEDNRVGIIVYGGGSQELLPLGHYTALSDDSYIKISEDSTDKNNSAYFPKITTNVAEQEEKTSEFMLADATYLQGALYQGMGMLAKEEKTSYEDTETRTVVQRTPVVITLTDGATNIISASETSHDTAKYDWYNPKVGVISNAGREAYYTTAGLNPFYADCGATTGNGDDNLEPTDRGSKENKDIEVQAISTRSISNLLLAGYYKNKIESNYKTDMIGYSIGYNVDNVSAYAKEQLLATLDPRTYFGNREEEPPKLAQEEIDATREMIQNYVNNRTAEMRFPRDPSKTYIYVPTSRNSWANFVWNHPDDSANDLKRFSDIYYIDNYYTASDSQGIENIFNKILESVTSTAFIPINGENDKGVSNSLTYSDIIGKYLEVKDGSISTKDNQKVDMSMLLFGEMYNLEKAGIYDYQFIKNTPEFQKGWYNSEGRFLGNEENGNWENGDKYYLDESTAKKYISTINESDFTDKRENTVYTLYKFTDDTRDINTLKVNPSYGEDKNITYKLSDICVWLEKCVNKDNSELKYDETINVNIPVEALPTQVVTIDLEKDNSVSEYRTNLSNKIASTPLRLFYGVGVQDEVKSEDGKGIDIGKLSTEYVEENTDEEGFINLYSNYYSESVHKHDRLEENESIGDTSFTFSPSNTNKYYMFQKPLILYEDNTQEHKEISEDKDKAAYEEFVKNKKDLEVKSSSQLDANKYYYIELEYYLPTGDGKAKLVHVVESRKGSEFGSGIAGEDIKAGEFLVWYNPETGKYVPYLVDDGNKGKPDDNNYVIATKPQGLSTGEICVRSIPKTENITNTSDNVYVPVVSEHTNSSNIILNGYLGNNGRIRLKEVLPSPSPSLEPSPSPSEEPSPPQIPSATPSVKPKEPNVTSKTQKVNQSNTANKVLPKAGVLIKIILPIAILIMIFAYIKYRKLKDIK